MAHETIRVRLDETEYHALVQLAREELRPLTDYVRYLIREELARRGVAIGTPR